jgi:AP-4 complex subunit mu-1
MSISLFFILSPRGDTIIAKDFRGDMPPGMAEAFFRKVKSWEKGDAPPVFALDGINCMFVRKNGLLIACTTRYNMSPSIAIEFLNRTAKVFKDYCGVLSEESIRRNFILVYELLDEMLDLGYPQSTSTEALKSFVYNEAAEVATLAGAANPVRSALGGAKTQSSLAAQKPIALHRGAAKGGKQKNEIFVDILERLTVLFSPTGHVLNSTIDGCIQMKSYLAGNPGARSLAPFHVLPLFPPCTARAQVHAMREKSVCPQATPPSSPSI